MTRRRVRTVLLPFVSLAFGACAPAAVTLTPFEQGIVWYREGQYREAFGAFDAAVRRAPQSAAAYSNRGAARIRLGDIDGAIVDYTRAMELTPGDAELFFNRGNAYVAGGHPTFAIADYTRALELRAGYAAAHFNRGSARARAGDVEGARADWRQAVELEPDPWRRAAMRRSAGLDAVAASPVLPLPAAPDLPVPAPGPVVIPPVTAAVRPALPAVPAAPAAPLLPPPSPGPPPEATAPAVTLPPPPPLRPGETPDPITARPVVPERIDARALATRGLSRAVDGDRAGALEDLRAAQALETDPARQANLEDLIRLLESPPAER
jgi:tetratricopeptide (TPR) repeat protein